jgi:dihydropyrimidinase
MLHSNADYSVYEGWEVTGWPVVTVRRGEVVFQEGRVLGAPGSGQVLRREPMERL